MGLKTGLGSNLLYGAENKKKDIINKGSRGKMVSQLQMLLHKGVSFNVRSDPTSLYLKAS